MNYPTYSEYGELEADWLGVMPRHWSFMRLRFIASEPLMYGANEAAVLEDPQLPRYIRITDVKGDGTLHDDTFRSLEEEVATPYLLQDGDILLARSGATVGKSFQYLASWGRAACAGYLIRYRPDQSIVFPRFANYYFQTECYWACIRSTLIQSTIENFSAEKYKELKLPIPPLDEQQNIAAFLDWKMGQIDALIAKKKDLMEKLKEKRLAVITQAVTNGINLDASLRDIGIPWLVCVPDHWEVKRGRFAMRVNPSAPRLRNLMPEDEVSFIPMDAVGMQGKLSLEQTWILADVSSSYTEFQDGDVVVAKITPCFENGKAALANGLMNGAALGTTELHVLRADAVLDKRFLFYVAISDAFRKIGESEMYGAGGQKRVPPEFIKDFRIPLPPMAEQSVIVDYLDERTGNIDLMMNRTESAITHLIEYRTAIITAATTGKIDVRQVAIPTQAKQNSASDNSTSLMEP